MAVAAVPDMAFRMALSMSGLSIIHRPSTDHALSEPFILPRFFISMFDVTGVVDGAMQTGAVVQDDMTRISNIRAAVEAYFVIFMDNPFR